QTSISGDVDPLLDRAAEIAAWYRGPTRADLYAFGDHGHLVGRDVDELTTRVDPTTWSLDQLAELDAVGDRDAGTVPGTFTGRLPADAGPGEALAIVDGTVAGVVVIGADGWFRGLVDPATLAPGRRTAGLLLPGSGDTWIDPGPPGG
ncbi:MAG: hypothetical protein AAGK32_10675, partial [Actinomycetota bacterium]